MKKAISFFLAALLLLSLCACTPSKPEPTPDVRPTPPLPVISQESAETPEPTVEPTQEPPFPIPSDTLVEMPLLLVNPEPTPESTSEPTSEPTADPDAELVADLEWYFNQFGMNGLLQTAYDDITELHLREVLYQLTDDEVSHEEARAAYTAAFEEPFTDLSYMQDWNFENYVWYITGHSLDAFPDYESLPYDPVSGLYFDQHGDTNYQPVKVLSVEHGEGSILYVHYCAGWEWDSSWFYRTADDYGWASDMLLTLTTETNLPCQFLPISNTPYVLEDW